MERILIIGCGGSGKSTLARELGLRLSLPVIHLDQLWWKAGWENVSIEEFDEKLEKILSRDRWVIDGNYNRTMPQRLRRCDTVIYLDFPRWACLWGGFQRQLMYRGKVRPDMAPGCPEQVDREFLKWIWNYNRDNRVRNETYLASAGHARRIVLKSRKEVNAFLNTL